MLCSFFVIGLQAQQTQIKGARSWNTISSLLGISITAAKEILNKEGLSQSDKKTDKDLKMDVYSFYRSGLNEDDKEDEPAFTVFCRYDKVVTLEVNYFYLDDDGKDVVAKDVADMQKFLKTNYFVNEIAEDKYVRFYKNSNKNLSAAIYYNYTHKFFFKWNLIIGEPEQIAFAIKE